MSDDGTQGLTLIAFVGSVFSPYYAWARRRGHADPMNHCALNVALYGGRAARWSMTERGAAQVAREAALFSLGRSALRWTGDALDIAVDEVCAPVPRKLRGRIRVLPAALGTAGHALDGAGRHRWIPLAPRARVELDFTEPALRWSGVAYLDCNYGIEPLEQAFRSWTWSRCSLGDATVVLYDIARRDGTAHSLALRFPADAVAQAIEPPPAVHLPMTAWRIARQTRADAGHGVQVTRTLEDAPFYSRSLLDTCVTGSRAAAVHESLDLERFRSRWVQCLLPFRMPRRPSGG